MAGNLTRAIQRTGGIGAMLDPIIRSFQAIQDQNRKLAYLKNIQDTYKNYTDQLNQINNATQPQTTQVPNPNYQPYNQTSQQQPIDIFNIGRNALTPPTDKNVNNEVPPEMVTRPTFDKTTNVPLSDVQKLNRAQGLANSTIMDLFTSPNSKYDSGQLNFLSRLIDQGTEQFRPSYKYINEKPTERQVVINTKTGERKVVNEAIPDAKNTIFKGINGTYPIINGKIDFDHPVESKPAMTEAQIEANKDRDRRYALELEKFKAAKLKPPDLSKEEGLISKYEEQLNNVDYALNETDDKGNKKNRINKDDAIAKGEPEVVGLWQVFNPITNKQEYMTESKVNQLKKELSARLEATKQQRQSKIDKVFGKKENTTTSQNSDVEANIKAYAKKWGISEEEARSYLK